MAIPQKIKQAAENIRKKIYGKEVRESLAKGIEVAGDIADESNSRSKDTEHRQTVLETQFDDQIRNMTLEDPSSAEMVAGRTNAVTGENHPTIGRRLDADYRFFDEQLADTPNNIKPKWSVWAEFEKRVVNVEWFAHLVVNGDWTPAVQAAINIAKRKVIFPSNINSMRIGMVLIDKELEIDVNGLKLIGTEDVIFGVNKRINYFKIHGVGGVEFEGVVGTHGKHFFANYSVDGVMGANPLSFPQGDKIEQYPVKKLIIEDNILNCSKVAIVGDDTVPKVRDNEWEHGPEVSAAPYYLYVYKGWQGDKPILKDGLWIKDNTFKVYPPDGTNKDILKVTAGVKNAKINGNHIENKNPRSAAQADVYTGGHHATFNDNTLKNVQYHRKQVIGENVFGEAPSVMGFDSFVNNDIEFEEGFAIHRGAAVYLHGSLFNMSLNRIKITNNDPELIKSAFYIDTAEAPVGQFHSKESLAFILSNNIVDLTDTSGEAYFINSLQGEYQNKYSFAKLTSTMGNVLAGGTRFMYGAFNMSSLLGNIWLRNERGERFINAIDGSVAVGNISENKDVGIEGMDRGNSSALDIPIKQLSPGENNRIDVNDHRIYVLEGSTSAVINLTNGVVGQEVTLISNANNITIRNNNSLKLKGNTNFVMNRNSTITLIKIPLDRWVEISRSETEPDI